MSLLDHEIALLVAEGVDDLEIARRILDGIGANILPAAPICEIEQAIARQTRTGWTYDVDGECGDLSAPRWEEPEAELREVAASLGNVGPNTSFVIDDSPVGL